MFSSNTRSVYCCITFPTMFIFWTFIAHHPSTLRFGEKFFVYLMQFCITNVVFRLFREIAKIDYWLYHVRPSTWNNSTPTGRILMKLDIWNLFRNCRENSSFVKIRQEERVLYIHTCSYLWQYLAELFVEWHMFQANTVAKTKTHILCSVIFFKSRRLWECE